jgi:hypothetical protein
MKHTLKYFFSICLIFLFFAVQAGEKHLKTHPSLEGMIPNAWQ